MATTQAFPLGSVLQGTQSNPASAVLPLIALHQTGWYNRKGAIL